MAERLLVVGFGDMSIYLGYKLFFRLPNDKPEHEGKLVFLGMKVVLSRVGPEIFFAAFGAFGAFVLISNLNNGIDTKVQTTRAQSVAQNVAKNEAQNQNENQIEHQTGKQTAQANFSYSEITGLLSTDVTTTHPLSADRLHAIAAQT